MVPHQVVWGFLVGAAFWPGISGAILTPKWIAIAVGAPLCSQLATRFVWRPAWWLVVAWFACGVLSLWSVGDIGSGLLDLLMLLALGGVFLAGAEFDDLSGVLCGLACGTVVGMLALLGDMAATKEALAEVAAPLLVWFVMRRSWIALAPLSVLLVCHSRIASVAVVIGLIVGRRFWVPALAASLLAVTWITLRSDGSRLVSIGMRLEAWQIDMGLIGPWFGHGIGTMRALVPFGELAHSDVLQAVIELGILALPVLVLPVLLFWRGTGAEGAAFAAICFEALVSFPLHAPASGFLAALLAGHLARVRPVLRGVRHDGRDEIARRIRGLQPV